MRFIDYCVLKRATFPLVPCDEKACSWYINESGCNNCFWVLSHVMAIEPTEFDVEEIAQMEGITVEEVNEIIEGAFTKLRRQLPNIKKEDE